MSNLEKLGGMEALAAELHNIYQEEAKRQGDVRHKDKYEDLPDNIKQFDRVLAAFILGREQALIERVEELERELEKFAKCSICGRRTIAFLKLIGPEEPHSEQPQPPGETSADPQSP